MKKTLVKAFAMSAIAIALVVASVLGTMAYFTASSAVSNVFTVGNVGIQMFESKVNSNGLLLDMPANTIITPATSYHTNESSKKTADSNSYKLVPGKTYIKDPTIYVDANSESSYLFLKVRNDLLTVEAGYNPAGDPTKEHGTEGAMFSTTTMRAQLEANGWVFHHENTTTGTRIYVYGTKDANGNVIATKVGGATGRNVINTFYTFSIAENAENKLNLFGGARVDLVAYAIQDSGLATVDAAWNAIADVYPYESGITPTTPSTTPPSNPEEQG